MTVLWVALGGALGAVARSLTDQAVAARNPTPFPLGTLLVNVVGSVLLGVLVGAQLDGRVPDAVMAWATTGFLGAYTTFSTFIFETLHLVERREWRHAAWNLLLSGPVCFAGAALGYWVMR